MATTEQRTQDFKHLASRTSECQTIEMQMRKLQRLQDSLAHWKTKLASNGRECDERNRALREEKDAISRHFQELKSRMNKFRESEGRGCRSSSSTRSRRSRRCRPSSRRPSASSRARP